MEKIFWIQNGGAKNVNEYLEKGWTVKLLEAAAAGGEFRDSYAYVVLEKKDE